MKEDTQFPIIINDCPVCGEAIELDHPKVLEDDEWMHIGCTILLGDGDIIDNEHG